MTLKPQRNIIHDNNSFFMNHVATAGGVVCYSTAGSGVAMDQAEALVEYAPPTSGSANVVGLLLEDVVNKDLTDTSQNYYKTEVQKGGKVTLVFRGEVTTDYLHSGITVSAGDTAYLHNDGRITNDQTALGAAFSPQVGKFLSTKDENGYAKVLVDL